MQMYTILTGCPLYGIFTVLLLPPSTLYAMVYTVRIPLGLTGILHSIRTDVESIVVTALITGGLGATYSHVQSI